MSYDGYVKKLKLQDRSSEPPRTAVRIDAHVGDVLYCCDSFHGLYEAKVVFERRGRVKLQFMEDGLPLDDCPPCWLRKNDTMYFPTKREAIIDALICDIERESAGLRDDDNEGGIHVLYSAVEVLWKIRQGEDAVDLYENEYLVHISEK